MPSDAKSPLLSVASEIVASLLPGMVDLDNKRAQRPPEAEAGPRVGTGGWGDDLGGVIGNVRAMGGDAKEMARRYRSLAANQGDADAR